MKKLLLLGVILVGGVTASRAGVHFDIGIGLPFPAPVIVSRPCAPAPPVCAPEPVCPPRHIAPCPPRYVAPCPPPVTCYPRGYYYRPSYGHGRYYYYGDRRYDYGGGCDRGRDYGYGYGYERGRW